MPNVERPCGVGGGVLESSGWSVGPPGRLHITMSFAGEEPDTRLGHRTIARLCASIKFVDERKDTSCIKSKMKDQYCCKDVMYDVRRV